MVDMQLTADPAFPPLPICPKIWPRVKLIHTVEGHNSSPKTFGSVTNPPLFTLYDYSPVP